MTLIINTSVISVIMVLLVLMTRVPNEQPHPQNGDYFSYSMLFIFAFWFVLTFSAAFREGFQDTGLYKTFYRMMGSDFAKAFDETFPIQDIGFNLIMVVLNRLDSNPQLLIIFCSVAITGIYIFAVVKNSSDLPFSLLLFLFLVYIPTLNGIRQILAAAVIVLAWPWLRDKKLFRFIVIVLLASTIHASAIILIPLGIIISGKRYNFGIIVFIVAIIFCFVVPSLAMRIMGSVLEDSTYDEYVKIESKMGFTRLVVDFVPVVLGFLYHRITRKRELNSDTFVLSEQNRRFIDMMVNMQIVSFGFTALGLQMVYFARMSLYFSLVTPIVLPRLINDVCGEKNYNSVKVVTIFLYAIFYCYQIHTYKMVDNWGGMELIF